MSAGRIITRALVFAIHVYRNTVSPLRPASCRFVPTCSQYAVDALMEYGLIKGTWLAVTRLAKCGPWHRGGWDPIPERRHGTDLAGIGHGREPAGKQGESESFVV